MNIVKWKSILQNWIYILVLEFWFLTTPILYFILTVIHPERFVFILVYLPCLNYTVTYIFNECEFAACKGNIPYSKSIYPVIQWSGSLLIVLTPQLEDSWYWVSSNKNYVWCLKWKGHHNWWVRSICQQWNYNFWWIIS